MTTQVKIGVGSFWLNEDAAASYARAVAAGCPKKVTSAGRTRAEQKKLFDDWKAGRLKTTGAVSPPGSVWSLHEKGNALDLPEPARAWMHKHGHHYGWTNPAWAKDKNGNYEPWHFEYYEANDKALHSAILPIIPALDDLCIFQWQLQLGGLDLDGSRGPATNRRIKVRLNAKRGKGGFTLESSLPLNGDDTERMWKAVQKLLNVWAKRGLIDLKAGPLKLTGRPDSRTVQALRKSLNEGLWFVND